MNSLPANNLHILYIEGLLETAALSILFARAIKIVNGKIVPALSLSLFTIIALTAAYSGTEAIEHSLLGAAAALMILLPLARIKLVEKADVAASIPLGALIGPLNFVIVFAIAGAVYILQKFTGSEVESAPEYISGPDSTLPLNDKTVERSALAEIEAKRLFKTEYSNSQRISSNQISLGSIQESELMPWALKIMFAAIIVFFLVRAQ